MHRQNWTRSSVSKTRKKDEEEMKTINGNLLDMAENGDFDVIIHGCNCRNVMGAGIARQIAMRYPQVLQTDMNYQAAFKDDPEMQLGTFSHSNVVMHDDTRFTVVNAYTQINPGADFELEALEKALKDVLKTFGGKGNRFGYPQIGCGIGGGEWGEVAPIFNRVFGKEDHAVVIYEPPRVKVTKYNNPCLDEMDIP